MGAIVDEGVKGDQGVVGAIVDDQGGAVGHFAGTIAEVDADIISLEIIAGDLVAIAEEAEALGVAEYVSVDDAVVAVAQRELGGGTVEQRVIAEGVSRGAIGDQVILAPAADEQIVFHQSGACRKAEPAEAKANHLGGFRPGGGEVVKVIMMNPEAACDLAAGAGHGQHTPRGLLRAEIVVVDLGVVPEHGEVGAIADALERVAGKAHVAGVHPDGVFS